MAAKKTAAGKVKKPDALEFCRVYLRKKPAAPFAEIRDAAAKKKLTLYPISYGRAKALEGLVKVSPYGSKKKNKTTGVKKRGPGRPKGSKNKRGPGRPKMAPKATGSDSIENLVSTIQGLQRERDDALLAIEQIRRLLDKL